jgi:hypothetical protein
MDAAKPMPPPATPPRAPQWLWGLGLLAAGVILGLGFAAYGGADLLLNFTNLRYCG